MKNTTKGRGRPRVNKSDALSKKLDCRVPAWLYRAVCDRAGGNPSGWVRAAVVEALKRDPAGRAAVAASAGVEALPSKPADGAEPLRVRLEWRTPLGTVKGKAVGDVRLTKTQAVVSRVRITYGRKTLNVSAQRPARFLLATGRPTPAWAPGGPGQWVIPAVECDRLSSMVR